MIRNPPNPTLTTPLFPSPTRFRAETPAGKVRQARKEAKAQHGAQGEYMVGRPAGVGVMLYDPEIGAMAGEAIKDIGRLVRRRRDHVDVVGRALIGIVRVEAEAMIDAVAGVDVAAGCASIRDRKSTRLNSSP